IAVFTCAESHASDPAPVISGAGEPPAEIHILAGRPLSDQESVAGAVRNGGEGNSSLHFIVAVNQDAALLSLEIAAHYADALIIRVGNLKIMPGAEIDVLHNKISRLGGTNPHEHRLTAGRVRNRGGKSVPEITPRPPMKIRRAAIADV